MKKLRHSYGRELRTLRVRAKLSQQKVANVLQFKSAQFLSNIERGLAQLPHTHISAVAKLYRVSPARIIRMLVEQLDKDVRQAIK